MSFPEVRMRVMDPVKPIATCLSETCDGCPVHKTLHCHFTPGDWIHFLFIASPPFLLGGAGIYYTNRWMLVPWLIMIVGYFGFFEIRVMCSHCPHYAEPGGSLRCWANYGSPKIWKYRPGPMSAMEKVLFLGGFVVIWGYPVYFLVEGSRLFLLAVYVITAAGFFMTLKTYLCSRCMNFACPLNGVEDETREEFFKRNPDVAGAWGRDVGS
jgi:hypothetical protein